MFASILAFVLTQMLPDKMSSMIGPIVFVTYMFTAVVLNFVSESDFQTIVDFNAIGVMLLCLYVLLLSDHFLMHMIVRLAFYIPFVGMNNYQLSKSEEYNLGLNIATAFFGLIAVELIGYLQKRSQIQLFLQLSKIQMQQN